MQQYDQIFEWYLDARDHQTGVDSVKAAFANLDPCSTVVDLGCGTGLPLAMTLKNMGLQVIGVDSSYKMVEAFKANLSECKIHHALIQDYAFPEKRIDGVLCWGCLFHLPPDDQVKLLNNIFSSVCTGGRLLFSSAKENDQTTGQMNGVTFNYYSLGSEKYNELAESAGWKLIHESADEGKNYQYLFEKR